MDLNNLRQIAHDHLLALRNLLRYMDSQSFIDAFEAATVGVQLEAASIIEKRDTEELKKWVGRVAANEKEYHLLNVIDLRKIAAGKVPDYQNLSKDDLIVELLNYERRVAEIRRLAEARRNEALRDGNESKGNLLEEIGKID